MMQIKFGINQKKIWLSYLKQYYLIILKTHIPNQSTTY